MDNKSVKLFFKAMLFTFGAIILIVIGYFTARFLFTPF